MSHPTIVSLANDVAPDKAASLAKDVAMERSVATAKGGSLDDFVQTLRSVCYGASLALSLRVGQLLLDRFYEGSVTVWRSRGTKHPSLRQLARRTDLPMSGSSLYRCLSIYELAQQMPEITRAKHLAASHVRAVFGLAQHEQRRLLGQAEAQRWSVAEIEATAAKVRHPDHGAAEFDAANAIDEPPPPPLRALRRIRLPEASSFRLEAVPHKDLVEIRQRLRVVREQCDRLEAAIQSELSRTEGSRASLPGANVPRAVERRAPSRANGG